jgi:multidrug efflux system outer membrane protein
VLRHAGNRYRAGYSSYLEQLDAERNLLSAELALLQATSDELNGLVALSQALGGGWTAP